MSDFRVHWSQDPYSESRWGETFGGRSRLHDRPPLPLYLTHLHLTPLPIVNISVLVDIDVPDIKEGDWKENFKEVLFSFSLRTSVPRVCPTLSIMSHSSKFVYSHLHRWMSGLGTSPGSVVKGSETLPNVSRVSTGGRFPLRGGFGRGEGSPYRLRTTYVPTFLSRGYRVKVGCDFPVGSRPRGAHQPTPGTTSTWSSVVEKGGWEHGIEAVSTLSGCAEWIHTTPE